MFWAKCFVSEWAILILVIFFFFKDNWIKAFLLLCLFQFVRTFMLGGQYRMLAFSTFYYVLLFFVVYQVFSGKIRKPDTTIIINGLCVLMLGQVTYMYFQYFGMDPLFTVNSRYVVNPHYLTNARLVTGFWAHTNISGASLAIALPLFFRKRWCVFILPVLVMLVLTLSFGSVIAVACGIIFFLLFYFKKKIAKVGLLVLVLSGVFIYGTTIDKKHFNMHNDRIAMLRPALKMIEKHPIVGYGLGQYKLAHAQISHFVFGKEYKRSTAHFDLIEAVVDIGAFGGLIILGFFGSLFLHFLRNKTIVSLCAISGLIAGLVNSCSTFVFRTPLAWILLILIVVIRKEERTYGQGTIA